MNRLILVGNGFDLAHGLKTSYRDFIDDFWQNKFCEILDFIKVNNSDKYIDKLIILNNCNRLPKNILFTNFKSFIEDLKYYGVSLKFNNNFLKLITEKCYENWVDIEDEYYNQLKDAKTPYILPVPNKTNKIEKLNQDFEEIKILLIKYLNKLDKRIAENLSIRDNIYYPLKISDLESKSQEKLIAQIQEEVKVFFKNKNSLTLNQQRFLDAYMREGEKQEFLKNKFDEYPNEIKYLFNTSKPKSTLLLNFNYTNTPRYYNQNNEIKFNFIHGDLENKKNPIIFGFGDDVDKRYQEFEDLNDNRYLENFKSIAYLQTDNYKKLLEYIDSEDYQVFIFGHSCGISDRTMLNTIFEHDNCKSVKPFYHKREDGSDNYTEIVQNISRNFNDKKKFRDRVVNKTYCEPLT